MKAGRIARQRRLAEKVREGIRVPLRRGNRRIAVAVAAAGQVGTPPPVGTICEITAVYTPTAPGSGPGPPNAGHR